MRETLDALAVGGVAGKPSVALGRWKDTVAGRVVAEVLSAVIAVITIGVVDAIDSTLILQFVAGFISSLPP